MKIFEGLNHAQAIQLGDRFVVALNSGEYLINGIRQKFNGYNTNQVVVKSLDNIQKAVPDARVIECYEDDEGCKISVEEHKKLSQKKMSYWEENAEEFIFNTVEDQIEHIKLCHTLSNYKAKVSITPQPLEPVEITVVGSAEDTGSEFIETPFVFGKVSWGNGAGVYKVFSGKIAGDEIEKLMKEYPEVRFENSTHSHYKYFQINGKYALSQSCLSYVEKGDTFSIYTTLKDAKASEQKIRKEIRKLLGVYLVNTPLSSSDRLVLIKDLERIMNSVRGIESKQKTYSNYHSTLKTIRETINKFQESA